MHSTLQAFPPKHDVFGRLHSTRWDTKGLLLQRIQICNAVEISIQNLYLDTNRQHCERRNVLCGTTVSRRSTSCTCRIIRAKMQYKYIPIYVAPSWPTLHTFQIKNVQKSERTQTVPSQMHIRSARIDLTQSVRNVINIHEIYNNPLLPKSQFSITYLYVSSLTFIRPGAPVVSVRLVRFTVLPNKQ